MSQFFVNTGSSGPVPPSVPTSFIIDEGGPVTPQANAITILGDSSTEDNVHGIVTTALGSPAGQFRVALTNRFTGSTNTPDATPKTVGTLALVGAGTYNLELNVAAYAPVAVGSAGFSLFVTVRSTGGVATIINQDKINNIESVLSGVDFNATSTGTNNNVLLQATGIAASIDWNLVGLYVYVG